MILRNEEKWVNSEWYFDHAPGVEIGDQFRFKVNEGILEYLLMREWKIKMSVICGRPRFNGEKTDAKYIYDGLYTTEFIMDYDVSQGKENIPILAINAIDDERTPTFHIQPHGCSCTSGCSAFEQCSCASKNGGEFPFNPRSSILKEKPLVHECGPS
ncbi:hypothetical protein KY290_026065 [Solanum tuberosum]|uniref:Pre-SET domain-containing protein n=1 Tax=Solanum tuberosum TaxID=4113 RepID=A0ABQ7UVD9_SOLTU|nr:hypothetical protein KY289_025127 [Solanum tuberosum]KAH0673833.1 hypothetical protein KY284_024920 [Solanum tuberosum]KAH0677147.1 hypothetical protein KY285_024948 [Solanum tuberosum]KAH0755795.1 hypothetical protein KY290_026065 [Solanum tuberosum]